MANKNLHLIKYPKKKFWSKGKLVKSPVYIPGGDLESFFATSKANIM